MIKKGGEKNLLLFSIKSIVIVMFCGIIISWVEY